MSQGTVGVNILSSVVEIGGSNVSAFGDIITVLPNPVIQLDWVYGVNTQTGITSVVTTGVADTSAGRLRLQSGVGAAGAATFKSVRYATYRSGQGMIARFTGVWTTSAASSTQVVGVGSTEVGYFFGYNGTAFGLSIRNGSIDSWVAQTAWNGDKCDGTGASGFNWNKTLGNLMMIRYPFLGFGAITYWVEDPVTGSWILCHTIQYPNSSASLQVSNASFQFLANVTNAGSVTNLLMYVGSVGVFVTGNIDYLRGQWGVANLKTSVSTELNILSIRCATTYNGVTNTSPIRLRSLSFCSDGGNGCALLTIKKAVTLGGAPSYTTINGTTGDNGVTITSGNSVASFDVAGTTITGGTQVFNGTVARNGDVFMDISNFKIFVAPGETMTFSVTSQVNADIRVAVNWNEEV